jgi:hypothetical protein
MANLVNLNIGGYKFTTTKATLTSSGDNFFTGLLSSRIPTTVDPDGYHFVDSKYTCIVFIYQNVGDGKYFEPILEFLRTSQLIIPNYIDVGCIYREAEFYGVDLPVKTLPVEDREPKLHFEGVYFSEDMASSYVFAPDGRGLIKFH